MNKTISMLPENIAPGTFIHRSLRLFFIIFMLTGVLISGIMMFFYHFEIETQLNNFKYQENFALKLQNREIGNALESLACDLHFLTQQNELQQYFDNKDSAICDKIASEYVAFAQQKQVYDQIRFINRSGLEIVRVNFNQGKPERVDDDKLQSKQNRYYFKDTIKLAKNSLFISPFDLNIENGIIEVPLKPMIRLSTPVFDSKGQKQGIIVLNYLGKNLLNKILSFESISEGKTMLLNGAGYWLLSPDPKQAWGFMFKDKQRSFSFQYKDIWEKICLIKHGQIDNDDGLFTFSTIHPFSCESDFGTSQMQASCGNVTVSTQNIEPWYLVSFASVQTINSFSDQLQVKFFTLGLILFIIIAVGAWGISQAITRRKIYQSQLQLMALFDPLTELPNRRLFFDRLKMISEHNQRNKSIFGLIYIDLDGFKRVNDDFGHKAGDEVLCVVASRLQKILRKSDTIGRLGGDEFAVIMSRLDSTNGAEIIAQKIIYSLAQPIHLKNGNIHIGASLGISLFPSDSDKIEELVQFADQSMYKSKNKGKNTYTFYSRTAS
ncbi:MAG: GGDEF domain-containing protein [Deltaproteobacteria bacterium]|nr:GGDEF domain-containing protein [Candidatus Tharpella sp.]